LCPLGQAAGCADRGSGGAAGQSDATGPWVPGLLCSLCLHARSNQSKTIDGSLRKDSFVLKRSKNKMMLPNSNVVKREGESKQQCFYLTAML
jgi:hypothetical protein